MRSAAALLLSMLLAGCAATRPLAAAGDVHALLLAVRDDDHAAFEAHVDRRALRAHLQARVVERARSSKAGAGLTTLGVLLSDPISRLADGLLVQPEVFRAIADDYGYRPGMRVPSAIALSTRLKNGVDGTVCATARPGGPCLLSFAEGSGVWRLVDIDPSAAAPRLRGR